MFYFMLASLLLGSWFLPWWWILVPAYFVGYWSKGYGSSLVNSSLPVVIVWSGLSFFYDQQSSLMVSQRMSEMLQLPVQESIYFVGATVGGVAAMFASFSGQSFKRAKS